MNMHDFFEEQAQMGKGDFAIAFALMELASAHKAMATHLKYLGVGDASTTMGAMEYLAVHIGKKLDSLTSAISEITTGGTPGSQNG